VDASQRESLLQLLEALSDLDGQYTQQRRVNPIGGGGNFSVILSARESITARHVAIKIMDPYCKDPYRLACFQREEYVLRSLRGEEGILVSLSDLSTLTVPLTGPGGIAFPLTLEYFVTELARYSLRDEIDQASRTNRTILTQLRTFRALCRALQRIHSKGIAHRDLKPTNVLRCHDHSLKLSDFGAARSVTPTSSALLTNYGGGWPGDYLYAAPEVVAGLHETDPILALRSDFYSLGAILFELLTGAQLGAITLYPDALNDLRIIAAMPTQRRSHVLRATLSALCAGYPPPSLAAYAPLPPCIGQQMQALFESLINLDYRLRAADFSSIFRQVSICEKILSNERAYRGWLAQRRRRSTLTLVRT
jgi:serine/threonine protein kinase